MLGLVSGSVLGLVLGLGLGLVSGLGLGLVLVSGSVLGLGLGLVSEGKKNFEGPAKAPSRYKFESNRSPLAKRESKKLLM